MYFIAGIDLAQIQIWLYQAGIWAPIGFVALYVIATLLILPSTALNLIGGAMFGPWWGTLWTSAGAIIAAVISFWFARTVGRDLVAERMAGSCQALDAEIRNSGSFYIFAIRLLPLIPYGIVSLVAGLTSLNFRDYSIGTLFGTVLGLFPFVWMGSSSMTAIQTGDLFPLLGALTLTALLMIGTAWYRRRRRSEVRIK
jgi:uncharacterized membrane protein YdjX (TVP38/TMEM64 family)